MRPPRRILVIALRRLGDLLLATPLLHALKTAWPQAGIEVLVVAGSEAMLEGNADVARVIVFRRGSGGFALLRAIARRYDLAVNLQPEDRGHLLALLAAPQRASILPPPGQPGRRWKRWLSSQAVPADLHHQHAVIQYLQLADALGLPRSIDVVPPRAAPPWESAVGDAAYAVIHPSPMYRYKAWPEANWAALIAGLAARGLQVVVTGGPDPAERALGERLAAASGVPERVHVIAGARRLAELTPLLERARVFIGPDTAITHLAAATGVPVIALFGPSNPVAWGPWPRGCAITAGSPWQFRGAFQQQGNVRLLQGTVEHRPGCIPCLREGCENRRDSGADCLDGMESARVLAAVDSILAATPSRSDIR